MNLADLLAFLHRIDRRPNKGLSQNFLIDQNIVKKIIRTSELSASDPVLEIGPGAGALTSLLLDAGAHVYAIEKDSVLARELERFQTSDQRLHVFTSDILDFNLQSIKQKDRKIKVIANLPYHITTPILEKLLDSRDLFSCLTIMIQTEVAERILAKPGSKAFSSLALFLQFHADCTASFKVPASCFYPRPKVDSTVLRLNLHSPPCVDEKMLFSIIRRAFQQRRKMIASSLRSLYSQDLIQKSLYEASARSDARPEELSLDQWITFYEKLSKKSD